MKALFATALALGVSFFCSIALAQVEPPPPILFLPAEVEAPIRLPAPGEASDPASSWNVYLPADVEIADDDSEIVRLMKERHNYASEEVRLLLMLFEHGHFLGGDFLDRFPTAMERLTRSRIDLAEKPDDRIATLESVVELLRHVEKVETLRYEEGVSPRYPMLQARGQRIDAEIVLLKAGQELEASRKNVGSR